TSFRRVAAGQLNDFLLEVAFDLDLVGSQRLGFVAESGLKPLRDKTLSDTSNGSPADPQSSDDVVIGPQGSRGRVCQQEDASMGEFAGRTLPCRDQLFQSDSFLGGKSDSVLVHFHSPLLETRCSSFTKK